MLHGKARPSLRPFLGLLGWLALALAAPACTSTTARLAGWYMTRQLDHYLDLSSEQKHELRTRVDVQLDMLRRVELPRWLYLLRQVRDTIGRGADAASLDALLGRYDTLLDAAVAELTPPCAEVLAWLDDAQIAHFEQRMLEKHEETYEEQRKGASERRAQLDERLVDTLQEILGELSADQQAVILAKVHALPDDRAGRYRVDRERIAKFARFLRGHPGAQTIEAELRRLWETRYQVLGPGRDKPARRREQRDLLLSIDRTLTSEQRAHAVEHLNEQIRGAKRFLLPPQ